jgi:hypothetical protein
MPEISFPAPILASSTMAGNVFVKQGGGAHHQPVEAAEPAAGGMAGVVKARTRRDR